LVKKKASLIPLAQRREFVDPKCKEFSIAKQCDILQIHRSGLYYKTKKANDLTLEIMHEIDLTYTNDCTIGTRRMTAALTVLGYLIGRKRVRSLMQKMRIKAVYCTPRTTIIDPAKYKYPYLLRGMKIDRSNQVWCTDITYIPMKKGYLYLTAIIDVYSRYIIHWSISNTMEASWVCQMVKEAIAKHGKPEILNSDQGSQYTSDEYIKLLKENGIRISMDGKGRALDNIYIERFWRTIKYDKIYLNMAENGSELRGMVDEFINYYNNKRNHQSLDYNPPIKYYLNAA
jgi:putative transposase